MDGLSMFEFSLLLAAACPKMCYSLLNSIEYSDGRARMRVALSRPPSDKQMPIPGPQCYFKLQPPAYHSWSKLPASG